MVRVSPASFSVSSGELSELMHGRRDFVRFQNGARALRGFIALPEGPVTRLPGTRFMGFTHDDAPARLMAFVFRDEDAVLLEWTDSLLRFWRGGALVPDGAGVYSLATPYSAARLAALQSLQSADRIYLTDGSLAPQRLSRFDLDDWAIEQTPFTGGPFAPRNLDEAIEVTASAVTGSVTLTATAALFQSHHVGTQFQIFEIDTSDTPYWSSDAEARIGDRVYYNGRCYEIVAFDAQWGRTGATAPHKGIGSTPPIDPDGQVLWEWVANGRLTGVTDWEADTLVALGDRRYLHGSDDVTVEVVAFNVDPDTDKRTTGTNPPIHADGTWLSEKGGCVWRALHDGNGIVRITTVTSATVASGTVEKRLPDGLLTKPSYRWAEQAWSDLRGWPAAIGAFEQRHIYGGTPTEPRTIWASVIGGTADMTTGANDDDGFSYILPAQPKNTGPIVSITGMSDAILVATGADAVVARPTDADRAFARETARFTIEDTQPFSAVLPVSVEGWPVLVDKSGKRLLAMLPDQSGKLRGDNLTMIARHVMGPGCSRIVRQELPVPIIWGVLADGTLMGCTYQPSQQVIGFHVHDLGGLVEDIEVLPSDDATSEDLWLVVRRTLGGDVRRCIEMMQAPFIDTDGAPATLADAWHQMCALRWQGAAATVISGLSHLNGETVTAWTNLGAFAGLVVASGSITLPRAVTSAIVGLDVTETQRFDTLDIVTGQPDGGDDGRQRVHRRTGIRVHRSAGGTLQVITSENGREAAPENSPPAVPLFQLRAMEDPSLRDGVIEAGGQKGWGHQTYLRFRPEPGAPLTISARTPTIMITDD